MYQFNHCPNQINSIYILHAIMYCWYCLNWFRTFTYVQHTELDMYHSNEQSNSSMEQMCVNGFWILSHLVQVSAIQKPQTLRSYGLLQFDYQIKIFVLVYIIHTCARACMCACNCVKERSFSQHQTVAHANITKPCNTLISLKTIYLFDERQRWIPVGAKADSVYLK